MPDSAAYFDLVHKALAEPDHDKRVQYVAEYLEIPVAEAAALFAGMDTPEGLRRIEAVVHAKQSREKPDLIVGGRWPSLIFGSRREVCADCRMYVSLSPGTGNLAKTTWPDVPVLCTSCAERRLEAEADAV
jgi:hypothetical protein